MNKNQTDGASSGTKGTAELPKSFDAHLSGATKTELLVDSHPIYLKVETATDAWAVGASALIGLGSILTGIAVAWISRANQKSQSKAVVAGFRKEWQSDLRNACSKLNGIASRLRRVQATKLSERANSTNNMLTVSADYKAEAMFDDLYQEFYEVMTTIEFLLDPVKGNDFGAQSKNNVRDLIVSMRSISASIKEESADPFVKSLLEFRECAKRVLEDAWTDIKNDAYGDNRIK